MSYAEINNYSGIQKGLCTLMLRQMQLTVYKKSSFITKNIV